MTTCNFGDDMCSYQQTPQPIFFRLVTCLCIGCLMHGKARRWGPCTTCSCK